MARPSRNTDRLLLAAGRRLLPETGIGGLSLRKLATEAGVNPGMFYFNFKTKQKFSRLVLQEIYEEFFKGFTLETGGKASSGERLKRALVALSRFARDNRKLFVMMMHDIIEGEEEAIRFSGENLPRHMNVVAGLIRDCQKKGSIKEMPLPCVVAFLVGSVVMPVIALGLMERASTGRSFGMTLRQLEPLLMNDAEIEARAEMALRSLRS